ncbi:MAG: DUF3343 domain-containing protein [Desulfomonile tiedjei]|uniref:DUF3343 domain-containing protein n=1 Tax=Desulfomonile tiedjei TaxID=2358 RepID=A0A9D6YZT2_9BACT|nr:DUF3343 domain-containing protein [Desulfomonile tiedjei]
MLGAFRKSGVKADLHDKGVSERGLLIFEHTSEVIRAESLLKEAGIDVAVKGPPPEVRTGCDLAITFPIVASLQVSHVLEKAKIEPLQVLSLQDLLLEPVSIYCVKDFGDYLMVRAANMKITVDKRDLRIVNISGGGCPDVPYLAARLVGKTLMEAPEPRSLGSTLCGYALQLAYEEMRRRCP